MAHVADLNGTRVTNLTQTPCHEQGFLSMGEICLHGDTYDCCSVNNEVTSFPDIVFGNSYKDLLDGTSRIYGDTVAT